MKIADFEFDISVTGAKSADAAAKSIKELDAAFNPLKRSLDDTSKRLAAASDNMQKLKRQSNFNFRVPPRMRGSQPGGGPPVPPEPPSPPTPRPRSPGGGGSGGGSGGGNGMGNFQMFGMNFWLAQHELSKLATSFEKAISRAVAFGRAITDLTMDVAANAKMIQQQANFLGMTTRSYQELSAVFEQQGVQTREMADIFSQLSQRAGMAAKGNKEAVATFEKFGISMEKLKSLSPEDIFMELSAGVGNIQTATDRLASLGINLGEEAQKQVGPLMVLGKEYIQLQKARASAYGVVLTDDELKKLTVFNTAVSGLKMAFKGLKNTLGLAFAEPLTKIAKEIDQWFMTNQHKIKEQLTIISATISRKFMEIWEIFKWLGGKIEERGGIAKAFDDILAAGKKLVISGVILSLGTTAFYSGLAVSNLTKAMIALRSTMAVQGYLLAGLSLGQMGLVAAGVLAITAALIGFGWAIRDVARYMNGDANNMFSRLSLRIGEPNNVLGTLNKKLREFKAGMTPDDKTTSFLSELSRFATILKDELLAALEGVLGGLIIVTNNFTLLKNAVTGVVDGIKWLSSFDMKSFNDSIERTPEQRKKTSAAIAEDVAKAATASRLVGSVTMGLPLAVAGGPVGGAWRSGIKQDWRDLTGGRMSTIQNQVINITTQNPQVASEAVRSAGAEMPAFNGGRSR